MSEGGRQLTFGIEASDVNLMREEGRESSEWENMQLRNSRCCKEAGRESSGWLNEKPRIKRTRLGGRLLTG